MPDSTDTGGGGSKPLMTLGGGTPPTLDYDLPQSTSLTANAKIDVAVPRSWFLEPFRDPAPPLWWQVDRDVDGVLRDLTSAVAGTSLSGILGGDVIGVLQQRPLDARLDPAGGPVGPGGLPTPTGSTPASTGPRREGRVTAPSRPGDRPGSAGRRPPRGRVTPPTMAFRASAPPTLDLLATAIVDGLQPITVPTLGGDPQILFIPPPVMAPRFYLVEEYRISSFLGRYGAGKTLSAFSLLPDEETEITVRTYEQDEYTATSAQNVLDSFSQSSADELETEVSIETGETTTDSTSSADSTHSESDISLVLNPLDLVNIGGASHTEVDHAQDASTVREENTNALNRALAKHVAESSYSREIEISSTTSTTTTTEQEQSTVRKIRNINHSRVLNFVWRQLLQQYETITYLSNVKVVFTTGDPTTAQLIELPELDDVLPTLVEADRVDEVRALLLGPYTTVFNHQGQPKAFVERVERTLPASELRPRKQTVSFWRKDPALTDEHEGITVPGVITGVASFVLPTAATIVEAVLSEGEALDTYNRDLQAATVLKADLENRRLSTALGIVDGIDDLEEKVEAYVAMLGPSPQVTPSVATPAGSTPPA